LWLGSARGRAAAYGVAVACSVQLVGTGIVAVKHWAPYYGAGGGIPADINTLKAEAIILSVAGAAGVVVGIDGLRHGGGFSSDAGVQRYLLAGVGLTTVLMLPWLLGRGSPYTTDATSLGGYAAMASVPCGVAIALAGWTAPVVSRAILVTVTISSVACWMSASPMNFEFSHPDVPFALTAVVTLVLQLLVPCRRQ
jgi:hypothetical protein